MKTVLIPLGGDIHAPNTKKAIRLFFKSREYSLVLLHVIIHERDDLNSLRTGEIDHEKNQEAIFNQTGKDLLAEGYQVEMFVLTGSVQDNIRDSVKKFKPSLMMMFTGGSSNALADLVGTNTSAIYDDVQCPTIIIPDESILENLKAATVGLSLEDDNSSVLSKYFEFAHEHDIHSSFVKIDSNLEMDIVNDETVLKELANKFPGKITGVVTRNSNNIAEGIEKFAKDRNSDLIVLFTTHRNFIEKLFHKSVTKEMVLHSEIPLLIYHY